MTTYSINILGDGKNGVTAQSFNGQYVTGPLKLAQRVMILLLSNEETEPRGTRLPLVLSGMANMDIGKLEGTIDISMSKVAEYLEEDETPDDETLSKYALELQQGDDSTQVSARLELTTVSGSTAEIVLPLTLENENNIEETS